MERQEFISKGWTTLPLTPGQKNPPLVKFAAAVKNGGPFDWNYTDNDNVGILLEPSNLIVIDVDHPERWDMVREGYTLPETYTVKTTRDGNGYHHYYKHTDRTRAIFKTTKIEPDLLGIDIKTTGYVVAAGSFMVERNRYYKVVRDMPVADFPDAVVDLYIKICGAPKETAAEALKSPLAWTNLRWLAFSGLKIQDREADIRGSRNNWAFGAGKDIGRYGWDMVDCGEIVEELYEICENVKPSTSGNIFTIQEMTRQFQNGINAGLNEQFEKVEEESPFDVVEGGMTQEQMTDADLGAYTELSKEDIAEKLGFKRLKTSVKKFAHMEPVTGTEYPWPKLNALTGGMKPGYLTFFGAPTSVGKTTIFREIMLDLSVRHKQNVLAFMLEDKQSKFSESMMSLAVSQKLNKKAPGIMEMREEAAALLNDDTFGEVYEFDWSNNDVDLKSIEDRIEHGCKYLDTKFIFVDGITAISADTTRINDAAYESIGKAVRVLFKLAERLKVHIAVITHVNDLVDKDTGLIMMNSAFGAKAITQFCDVFIGFNKIPIIRGEVNTRPDFEEFGEEYDYRIMEVLKERDNGKLGRIEMKYNRKTGRLVENNNYDPDRLHSRNDMMDEEDFKGDL